MRSNILEWLAEPKSYRVRYASAFGCFGAVAFGIPLSFLVLAFAAIPHCKTCSEGTEVDLLKGALLAFAFGALIGTIASLAQSTLARYCGPGGTVVVLLLTTIAAIYLSLGPALRWITG